MIKKYSTLQVINMLNMCLSSFMLVITAFYLGDFPLIPIVFMYLIVSSFIMMLYISSNEEYIQNRKRLQSIQEEYIKKCKQLIEEEVDNESPWEKEEGEKN